MRRRILHKLQTWLLSAGVVFLTPYVAYAQPQNFKGLVEIIIDLLMTVFPVIIGLTLLAFLWGLARFIFSLGNAQDASEGKTIMFWGVVALFVSVSVWGLVTILVNTFL